MSFSNSNSSKQANLYGIHVANILLEKYPETIVSFFVQEGLKNNNRINEIVNLARQYGLTVNFVPKNKLEQLTDSVQHQGIAIQCKANSILKIKAEGELKDFFQEKLNKNDTHKFFILILDGIQDPHNLGACIRSAEIMGADCIIMPQNNSAPVNNTVCKISSGAALLLPVFQVVNLARVIKWLKEEGVWVYGTAMTESTRLCDLDLKSSIALVMGAEGEGMRKLTTELCDQVFTIPMAGTIESLNVSVATGICLYEAARQRGGA